MRKINNPNQFLVDSGLLFEINRTVLHPIGLALAVQIDEQKDDNQGTIEIIDVRDDPEGMIFTEESYEHGVLKLKRYMEENRDNACTQERFKRLGFVVQDESDKFVVQYDDEEGHYC
jgi:hypothetical protein